MTHFADFLPKKEKLSYLVQLKSVKELLRWYENPTEEETKKLLSRNQAGFPS
jgi:hypothetical protein